MQEFSERFIEFHLLQKSGYRNHKVTNSILNLSKFADYSFDIVSGSCFK